MAHKDPVCKKCHVTMELHDIDDDSSKDYAVWIYRCPDCGEEEEVLVKY
jgi:predicted RNA-binding Zn-ribbon protein involved in translation (DUF1610 family)